MLTRRIFLTSLTAAPLGFALASPALAAKAPIYAEGGVAINGYDPVAYFTEGAPVEGLAEFSTSYMGADWRFASAEARDTFVADPEAYAPQYGGYCSYAVSKGGTATSSPNAWTVYEGKLYLNYNLVVRGIWSRDIPGHIAKADANWPGVLA